MDIRPVVTRLRFNAEVVRAQTAGLSDAQARWRPGPDQWSILEVVCHLADEEVRDFRTLLDLLLHAPDDPWPSVDPEAWAREERYRERSLAPELARFQAERARSLAFLEGLEAPSWSNGHVRPDGASIRAADMLASWVAHDLIHVRQINRLHRQYLEAELLPGCDPAYAGRW